MSSPPLNNEPGAVLGRGGVMRVVLTYLVVASAWILVSDRVVEKWVDSESSRGWWSTGKGWAFVAVTSGLLYLALRRLVRQVEEGRETLARSEARFRTLVEAASEAIVVESEARFTYANPAALELLGATSPEQLLGGYVVERFEDSARERVLARMRGLNDEGKPVGLLEVGVVRLDGARRRVELSAVPYATEGERGAMVLARDVTDRRAEADRLAEQFALVEGILRCTRDAVYVKDREGRYRLINPTMEAVLGRAAAEVMGHGDDAFFPSDVAARVRADDRRVMEGGVGEEFEEALPGADGPRFFLTSKSPLRSKEGAVIGVVAVARDIRERKQMEDALRGSEAKFAAFMAHLPGLASIQDPQGRFVFMNSAFEGRFGLRPGEALELAPESVLPAAVADSFRTGWKAVVETGLPAEREEGFGEGEARRTHLLSRFPIHRAEGGLFVGSMSVDITERKQAEEAVLGLTGRLLSLQDEERRRLAKELHDTTAQDLTAIGLGLTRVLQLLPKEGMEAVGGLVTECMGLVEQSGRDVRTLSYLLHPPLLDEMGLPVALREFTDGLTRRSGLRIQLLCSDDFGRIGRDREMALFRIAQESLANARRHAAGGVVRVELTREGGHALLSVSDDGGSEAEPERLRSLQEGSGSMGVGALGMRERVRQLGGDLLVESVRGRTAVRARVPAGPITNLGGGH